MALAVSAAPPRDRHLRMDLALHLLLVKDLAQCVAVVLLAAQAGVQARHRLLCALACSGLLAGCVPDLDGTGTDGTGRCTAFLAAVGAKAARAGGAA